MVLWGKSKDKKQASLPVTESHTTNEQSKDVHETRM